MWAYGFSSAIGCVEQVLGGRGGRTTTPFVKRIPLVHPSSSQPFFWPVEQALVSLLPWASPEPGARS